MIKIYGEVNIKLFNEHNELINEQTFHNLVVTVGCKHIADQLSSSPDENPMSHMAVGSGTTTPTAGQTALVNELARVSLTSRTQGSGGNADTVIYVATFGAGVGTGTLREAGIFNASSGGIMLCRSLFDTAVTKGANDTLNVTWTIYIGRTP